jgi:FdhD protein
MQALRRIPTTRVRGGLWRSEDRRIAEEVPVALVYDGTTHAVMMASPADLEDFAVGFSLTEGKIAHRDDITDLDIVAHQGGVEARIWLAPSAGQAIAARRRAMLGPTGCGLCGIDSLEAALPEVARVAEGPVLTRAEIAAATAALRPAQALDDGARALHAAAFWTPAAGIRAIREDVGRHNALDKLVGALVRAGETAADGAIVLTSRLSVEMVQKAAAIRAPIVIAVSVPTALALRTAEAAGLTVIAVARDDGFEIFTHPDRVARDSTPEPKAAVRATH